MYSQLIHRNFETELQFSFSRSSGAGGQHVNKVSTKIRLVFDVEHSNLLSEREKAIIIEKLKTRINTNGELVLECQSTRSQFKNKQIAIEKFYSLLALALTPKKKRKATKPTKASKERRLGVKRIKSEKKTNRKKLNF